MDRGWWSEDCFWAIKLWTLTIDCGMDTIHRLGRGPGPLKHSQGGKPMIPPMDHGSTHGTWLSFVVDRCNYPKFDPLPFFCESGVLQYLHVGIICPR